MIETTDRGQPGTLERILPGTVLLAVGLLIVAICWTYPMGTLSQMGPGFVPMTIGVLICLFSVAIIAGDLLRADQEPASTMHWRQLGFVSAAILTFAALVDHVGLAPAMFLAAFLSIFADSEARIPGALVYALLSAFAGWLLFNVALDLPIPAFWR